MAKTNNDESYLLVGGGLQNGLLALALLARRPNARVTIIERATKLFGDHTWSFHETDLPDNSEDIFSPLRQHHWPDYYIHMPANTRRIEGGYNSFNSQTLREVLSKVADRTRRLDIRCGCDVVHVDASDVVLADDEVLHGDCVIDARGPGAYNVDLDNTAYQKFVGLEVELASDANMFSPTLMDACVDQIDGYRFIYVLPYTQRRLLIEDTYFSDSPAIDEDAIVARILHYADSNNLEIARIERSERGCIPLPLASPASLSTEFPLRAGYGGGWFHPTTGYSFPIAARLAMYVAQRAPEDVFGDDWDEFAQHHRNQFTYGALLNQLLYTAFKPEDRWNVFERFHRLPDETIARFYSLNLNRRDKMRVVAGRPPQGFSMRAALARGISI